MRDNIPIIDLTLDDDDDDDDVDEHHDASQIENSTQPQTAIGLPEMVASETQDQAAVSGVSVELPYDTCFGVVCTGMNGPSDRSYFLRAVG